MWFPTERDYDMRYYCLDVCHSCRNYSPYLKSTARLPMKQRRERERDRRWGGHHEAFPRDSADIHLNSRPAWECRLGGAGASLSAADHGDSSVDANDGCTDAWRSKGRLKK